MPEYSDEMIIELLLPHLDKNESNICTMPVFRYPLRSSSMSRGCASDISSPLSIPCTLWIGVRKYCLFFEAIA